MSKGTLAEGETPIASGERREKRTTDHGPRTTNHGPRTTDHGLPATNKAPKGGISMDNVKQQTHYLAWFMLIFSFFMPAILLNTVGAVILNLVNSLNVSMGAASWLEAFKDISIMVGAFTLASFLPSFGYKKSLIVGICLELAGCILFALHPSLLVARIFFVLCGVGFALIKTTVYASVGLFVDDPSKHASFFSLLEGIFMGGVLTGMWIYAFFVSMGNWTTAFWFFALLCLLNLVVVLAVKLDESKIKHKITSSKEELANDITGMFSLFKRYAVWIFIFMAFFYVFIEQGVTTWLPVYNNHTLHISDELSIGVASLFPAALCIGRFIGAGVMKKIKWVKMMFFALIISFVIFIVAIFLSISANGAEINVTSWLQLPLAAYLIPLAGLFIAPIYPTICSSIVSSQPIKLQSSMAGIILLFSALGGTIGSRIVGSLFETFGGLTAIKAPLIPIVIIFILLIPYYKMVTKAIKRNSRDIK